MGSMSGLHRGSREEMKSQSVLAGVVLRGLRENRIPVTIEESRQKKARLLL
jgi:hypothetical protein